jgi:hypothetical protein
MSDHEQRQIADLTERLLATREQREDWAKFALDMQRERDAARADNDFARAEWEAWEAKACELDRECKKLKAERDALVRAIDDAMVSAHIGVFNPGDDPKDAINKLAVYEQGVGEYFMKADRDRLDASAVPDAVVEKVAQGIEGAYTAWVAGDDDMGLGVALSRAAIAALAQALGEG